MDNDVDDLPDVQFPPLEGNPDGGAVVVAFVVIGALMTLAALSIWFTR